MQWLVIARDGNDAEAERRRMAARPAHLENAGKLQAKGHLLVGGALVDGDGRMIGSACVAQFATRAELDEWLRTDPYVTGNVWRDIQISPIGSRRITTFHPAPRPRPGMPAWVSTPNGYDRILLFIRFYETQPRYW